MDVLLDFFFDGDLFSAGAGVGDGDGTSAASSSFTTGVSRPSAFMRR
jgi:hypothetical protein